MKRLWILPIVLSLVFVLIYAGFGAGAGKTVLKIATIAPEGNRLVETIRAASDEIQRKTGDRVSLRIYSGGVMGNDAVVLRKMRGGQLHGATFTAGGISSVYSNYQIMSLPLLFRNYREVDAVKAKIEPLLTQGLAQKGYISMGIMEGGFVYMMSNKPLRGLDDLSGQKIWIPEGDPIGRVVFETAGVPPIPLPLPNVLTGLQTGLIDTVCVSPVGAIALQWYTKVKYLTDTPLLYSYGTLVFAQQAWNRLSEPDREVVRDVLRKMIDDGNPTVRRDNEAALNTLRNQGLTFVPIEPHNLPRMQQIADEAIAKLMRENLFDAPMLAAIRSLVKSVRQAN